MSGIGGAFRVGIYCRVSTKGQSAEDKYSLPEQEAECRQHAQREGWTVAPQHVVHEVLSGYRPVRERPGLAGLLDAMEAGKIDAILCHDPDRLSRKQVVLGTVLDRIDRVNKERGEAAGRLRFVTGDFDHDATGTFVLQARVFAAELQRERIMEGSARGKRGKAKAGKPLGDTVPPFGLRYSPDKSRFEANPATIGHLRWMFDQADQGKSLRGIGLELERRGVLPPYHGRAGSTSTRWGETTVRRILGNEKYTGVAWAFESVWEPLPGLTRNGNPRKRLVKLPPADPRRIKLPDGVYPQVITPEQFRRVQALIAARASERQRKDRDPQMGLLRRGHAKCALCGYTLVVRKHSNPRIGYCYSCIDCGRRGCGKVSIMTHLLDGPVWRRVEMVLLRPQVIEERLAAMAAIDTTGPELEGLDREIARVEREQARLAKAVAKLEDELAQAPLVAELGNLGKQRQQLQMDRAEVQGRQGRLEADRRELKAVQDWTAHVRGQVIDEVAVMGWEEKRRALALLGAQVTVFPASHRPRWAMRLSWDLPDGTRSERVAGENFTVDQDAAGHRFLVFDGYKDREELLREREAVHAALPTIAPEAARYFGGAASAATASASRQHSSSVVR